MRQEMVTEYQSIAFWRRTSEARYLIMEPSIGVGAQARHGLPMNKAPKRKREKRQQHHAYVQI